MTTQRAGRRPSHTVVRTLALPSLTQANRAESAPALLGRTGQESPRSRPVAGRRHAWDTDTLRAQGQLIITTLAPLVDADPRTERKRADITLAPALWNHWRMLRLCRRYREVASVVDKMKSQALAASHTYTHLPPTGVGSPVAEIAAERAERHWREQHFPGLSLIACELRAQARPIYGAMAHQAEREGKMASRLARYRPQRPRTGHSVSDSPYVKIQRYPRLRAIRAWLKFCAGDMHVMCYGTLGPSKRRDDEIVTAADRVRRQAKRVRKSIIRAAAEISQSKDGLSTLGKIIAAARARLAS